MRRRNRFGETFFSAQALTEEEEEIDLGVLSNNRF